MSNRLRRAGARETIFHDASAGGGWHYFRVPLAHNHHHAPLFVTLSVAVAILGSWTALGLFRRVRSHIGQAQKTWLAIAGVAMGLSIWSMHFIAMLGFDPGSPVRYDLPLTFLSLILAIGATCGAFFAASRPQASRARTLVAGTAMGLGICLMHYVGMAALRSAVALAYQPGFVAASLVIAVAAATVALFVARRDRSLSWRAAAAVILGVAIAGMHYTAMAGLELTPKVPAPAILPGAPPSVLGVVIASGTALLLLLSLLASLYDQRLNVLSALEAGEVGYWELMLPGKAFHLSLVGKRLMGRAADAHLGHEEILAALSPEDRPIRDAMFNAAVQDGSLYDCEYRLRDADRWINIRGRVVERVGGRARRMTGVILDVTERRRAFARLEEAERRQRILIDELNHRVKNTLSTVQSIARHTVRGAASLEAFQHDFEARLMALSQTHNVLTRRNWQGADLRELVEQELTPYPREQVRVAGPDIHLSPSRALGIGMVMHELTTNAAKYGALSNDAGRLELVWDATPEGLQIVWSERGGPPVPPPSRKGFGSRLVRSTVEVELGGRAELDYDPAGFTARLLIPFEGAGVRVQSAPASRAIPMTS